MAYVAAVIACWGPLPSDIVEYVDAFCPSPEKLKHEHIPNDGHETMLSHRRHSVHTVDFVHNVDSPSKLGAIDVNCDWIAITKTAVHIERSTTGETTESPIGLKRTIKRVME